MVTLKELLKRCFRLKKTKEQTCLLVNKSCTTDELHKQDIKKNLRRN